MDFHIAKGNAVPMHAMKYQEWMYRFNSFLALRCWRVDIFKPRPLCPPPYTLSGRPGWRTAGLNALEKS